MGGNSMNGVTWKWAVCSLLIGLSIGFAVTGCEPGRKTPTIELVIPEGYCGLVTVRFEDDGDVIRATTRRRYTFNIPASGVMVVKGPNLFYDWHVLIARDTSGTSIPVQ